MEKPMDLSKKEVFDLMIHQIEFFKHVFGKNITKNTGIYIKNVTEVQTETILQLQKLVENEKVNRIKKMKKFSNLKKPKSLHNGSQNSEN